MLIQETLDTTMPQPKEVARAKKGRAAQDKRSDEEKDMQRVLDEPFFVAQDQIMLDANGTGTVVLQVLPFVPGVFRCQMVILSEEAGEFM